MEEEAPENHEFAFQTVGEKLKEERERRGWSLETVAEKTRIPMRHLESIEKSQYAKMPGSTYMIGFSRSYAKAVELDDAQLIAQLRGELSDAGLSGHHIPSQDYEPADPTSVPSKTLAWTAAIIAILIIAGFFIWRNSITSDPVAAPVEDNAAAAETAPAPDAAAPATTAADGQVVITATDNVWIKIYDADNKRLFEAEMKPGQSYNVPKDANGPMIVTGRPDMLKITVDGAAIAPLGDGTKTIADIGVSASALSARAAQPSQPTAAGAGGGTAAPPSGQ
ncbi:helix-turn-helix domain-containing protein [Sphingorhabdus arenilitoris]|uniref:Helix-turn-helix domain-containing protein n=1 Tax=Sphingorhabdus arenilitoris TaxID=1490041 RepID=A0ABV8RJC2_9SPHN